VASAVHASVLNRIEPVVAVVDHIVTDWSAHRSNETIGVAHPEALVASVHPQAGVAVDVAREVAAVVEVIVQLLKDSSCLVIEELPVVPVPCWIVDQISTTEGARSELRSAAVLLGVPPDGSVVGTVSSHHDVENGSALLWVSSTGWDLDIAVLARDAGLGP